MPWIKPITTRTESDIFNQTPISFVGDEDWNRLELNSKYLSRLLGIDIHIKLWGIEGFQINEEKSRILDNISLLRNAAVILSSTPEVPSLPFNTWQAWNDAEQILLDIYNENGGE